MLFYKEAGLGELRNKILSKSVQQFSSYEKTQHKNPFCLIISKAVKVTEKCIEHKTGV
jgi:hypothetical protein